MTYPKVHLDRCIEVAGDARAGVLLYHIMRWMKSTKVVRAGHRWATSTREEWAQQTNTSLKKVKTDLNILSAGKLLVREKHMYNSKSVLFLRPTDRCLRALRKPAGWVKSGQIGTGQSVQIGTGQSGQIGTDLYKLNSETQTETHKTASGFAVASPETICLPEKTGYQTEVGGVILFPGGQGGPDMTTAAEIAAKFAALPQKSIDTLKPDKVGTLEFVLSEHFKKIGKVAPAVTSKVRGQLKRLIEIWPAGQAPEILAFGLENWFDVTYAAEKQGAFKSPEFPEIGYLVKYQHVAVTCFLKSKMKAALSKSPPKPVQTFAKPEPDQADKPMTMAELQAMEAEEELKGAS